MPLILVQNRKIKALTAALFLSRHPSLLFSLFFVFFLLTKFLQTCTLCSCRCLWSEVGSSAPGLQKQLYGLGLGACLLNVLSRALMSRWYVGRSMRAMWYSRVSASALIQLLVAQALHISFFFFCEGNNLFSSFLPSPLHFSQDYQHDPYAEHNPCNTICCREDLNPSFPVPAGCYDSKVSYPISVSAECLLQPVCAPVRPVARFPALGQARPGLSLPSFHVVPVHGQIMRW